MVEYMAHDFARALNTHVAKFSGTVSCHNNVVIIDGVEMKHEGKLREKAADTLAKILTPGTSCHLESINAGAGNLVAFHAAGTGRKSTIEKVNQTGKSVLRFTFSTQAASLPVPRVDDN